MSEGNCRKWVRGIVGNEWGKWIIEMIVRIAAKTNVGINGKCMWEIMGDERRNCRIKKRRRWVQGNWVRDWKCEGNWKWELVFY